MNNPMLWVGYPRSYTAGRGRAVQFVTLHWTAGAEGPTAAEGGAAYDKTRPDGTSCHAFFDNAGPGLQELPFGDRAHCAFFHGNEIGVHYELCVPGINMSKADWLDSTTLPMLRTAAVAVRYACDTLGLELRRLSVEETRAAFYNKGGKPTGINDHGTVTAAFPEDNGSHTDVGPNFPWNEFIEMVKGSSIPSEDDTMIYTLVVDDGGGVVANRKMWLCNGMFRRVVKNNAELADIHYMAKQGAIVLWNNGETWAGGEPGLIAGWPGPWGVDVATLIDSGSGGGVATSVKLTAEGETQVYNQALKAAQDAEDS